ncbi:hypothetical protein BD289DRAFT_479407 [Coniella lustricola]|uniref:Uncharacterized protein n=1 Tax=Coniella lustricola TaxID=2025994 RepID=A0A2T3AJ07_9PEZI|nr:hypothetical protein BD289DRAFT_479407 [Coniella lustricola]
MPPTASRAGAAAALSSSKNRAFYATSAPKKAEEASAQSGGSRSKDAAERASENSKGATAPDNPTPHPKVFNNTIPGDGEKKLSKEQQEEVDRHNADFEAKHDRAAGQADTKVDKKFWAGQGGREEGQGERK